MNNKAEGRSAVAKYLIWAFVPAYIIQAGAAYLYRRGAVQAGQLVIAAMMYVPALAAVLAGARLKDLGWNPRIRKNIRPILAAWLSPAALTALGAVLYFLIFPAHFDASGTYITANAGEEALRQLEAQGISYPLYVLVSAVSAVTFAPLINTLAALGEEIGWRGFLYPRLKERFGRVHGLLLGGVIWGAWHWPLIWLIGYEYGAAAGNAAGYGGFPVSGMLLFCVITVGWGILHDWLYEKSGSIWVPALFHGAINAETTIPIMLCLTDTGSARLLGPASVGILAGLPLLIAAAIVFIRHKDPEK